MLENVHFIVIHLLVKTESYLVMYVVKSANDGGNSLFLSSSDIVNQLSKTETGKNT